jgi:uroporphyrinogen-III decarboxylase
MQTQASILLMFSIMGRPRTSSRLSRAYRNPQFLECGSPLCKKCTLNPADAQLQDGAKALLLLDGGLGCHHPSS